MHEFAIAFGLAIGGLCSLPEEKRSGAHGPQEISEVETLILTRSIANWIFETEQKSWRAAKHFGERTNAGNSPSAPDVDRSPAIALLYCALCRFESRTFEFHAPTCGLSPDSEIDFGASRRIGAEKVQDTLAHRGWILPRRQANTHARRCLRQ